MRTVRIVKMAFDNNIPGFHLINFIMAPRFHRPLYLRKVTVDNLKLRLDIDRSHADIQMPERKPGGITSCVDPSTPTENPT
jgi:hypothetical protein